MRLGEAAGCWEVRRPPQSSPAPHRCHGKQRNLTRFWIWFVGRAQLKVRQQQQQPTLVLVLVGRFLLNPGRVSTDHGQCAPTLPYFTLLCSPRRWPAAALPTNTPEIQLMIVITPQLRGQVVLGLARCRYPAPSATIALPLQSD